MAPIRPPVVASVGIDRVMLTHDDWMRHDMRSAARERKAISSQCGRESGGRQ